MQNAPDARVKKDTEPVIVTFPEMKARKLSVAESIVEVYNLDPKIDVGLSLWELTRLPGVLDSESDLWPFIVDGSKHPIFRKRPPSSDTQGTILYFVTWKAFEVIIPQMIHRITAGNAFTPWENQYVDVRPMETTPSEDKVAQAGQRRETEHIRAHTPTEKETIENQFEDAIVDGVPLLELDEANAEATDPEHMRDDHKPDGKISPSDQSSDADDSGHLEKIPAWNRNQPDRCSGA
ncbi:MAG: hypothetical protein L6R42_007290 [Xanthoria sp. 1 TBL-2021]|nr:MAG: hypothetical protein L6R42_007290 [Xanthoria sp. 1 TBL-2021]